MRGAAASASEAAVADVPILEADPGSLAGIALAFGLSGAEMAAVVERFRRAGRNPTDVELHAIGQLWSEHCRHKTFRGLVVDGDGSIAVDDVLSSYIARPTEAMGLPWVVSYLKDNAGVVEFVDGYGIAVKVETHNHPSAVDPFGGAATGVGGVLRDVLAVWAEPIALVDVLCFGPPDFPRERLGGLLHPRRVSSGVVAGVGHYGNNVGVPTVAGSMCFDDGYAGSPAVFAGCVGLLPLTKYVRDPRPGDALVLVGNRTGRDGIGGAAFASAALSGDAAELRPAVQIPDPVAEEKLIRFVSKVRDRGLASGITDLGGGGLAVAAAEIADGAGGGGGGGCTLYLHEVPLREEMRPWEILVSESQERMLLSAHPDDIGGLLEAAQEEGLVAAVVGSITSSRRFEAYFRGAKVADMGMEFALHPPRAIRSIRRPASPPEDEPSIDEPRELGEALLSVLSSPNVSSRERVIRTYDFDVRGNTVVRPIEEPFGGHNDAAVVKPLDDRWEGIVISVGLRPRLSRLNPYWMAASSLEEALRNNAAVGGRRMALLDNFAWGSPDRPEEMWSLVEAARACRDMATAFGAPFISGKDSLYNESELGPILPTLLITAVGVIPDVRLAVTAGLKAQGDRVYALGITRRELGGSEYYRMLGVSGGIVPRVRPEESKATMGCLAEAIDGRLLAAAHDVSEGGLAVAAAEMVLSSALGLELHLPSVPSQGVARDDHLMFSESNGRFLVEVKGGMEREFEELASKWRCRYAGVGLVTGGGGLRIIGMDGRAGVDLGHGEMRAAWTRGWRS